ncbi:hypothetical protein AHAS_Ahas20G0002900 [Arachis hypogaea]
MVSEGSGFVPITYLEDAESKGAVCLDGSPPAYHFDKGSGEGVNSWIVHLEGGGWCSDVSSCLERKDTRLGSSKQMDTQAGFYGILNNQQDYNPDFYNWNRIKIRYCDGSSFTGDVEEVDPTNNLHFRGARIFEAVIKHLLAKGMENAENAILSGCSAGGLAAILNCDRFKSFLPNGARVKCAPDAGYFIHVPDVSGTKRIENFYKGVVETHGSAKYLSKSCTSKYGAGLCFFPQYVVQDIATPIFVVNAAYDSWQIRNILIPGMADPHGSWQNCRDDIGNCTPDQLDAVQGFREDFIKALSGVQNSPSKGMFIDSCYIHCQTEMQESWFKTDAPQLANTTIAKAVGDCLGKIQVKHVCAVCLDGSPPAYHFDKGSGEGVNSWIVFLEGGGWCSDVSSCLERKDTRLGSSKQMDMQSGFNGILNNQQDYNPDFYNWNRIKIRYCDGSSFTGDVEEVDPTNNLHFRGARIFEAVIKHLLAKGMENAENAILSGCSAGGLAAILNCDRFKSFLPNGARVKCVPDAGYFINVPDVSGTKHIENFYNGVVETHGSAKYLSKSCTSKYGAGLCFFPQYVAQDIATPIFVVNAAYDSWQIRNILIPSMADPHGSWKNCKENISNCTPDELDAVQGFREDFIKALSGVQNSPSKGMFIDSCYIHCQTGMQELWFNPDAPQLANTAPKASYGDTQGDTLLQASLPMHQTRLRLGVLVTELALASADESSKSELLSQLDSQYCPSALFILSINECLTCELATQDSERLVPGE